MIGILGREDGNHGNLPAAKHVEHFASPPDESCDQSALTVTTPNRRKDSITGAVCKTVLS